MASCVPETKIPMIGSMVTRATPGTIPPLYFSVVFNMDGSEVPHYSRLSGWTQYGAEFPCFLNQDLHDQMDRAISGTGLIPGTCVQIQSEAVTMLYSAASGAGRRRLLAGTRTKLYAGDDLEGSWRIIGHGYGGGCVVSGTDLTCSDTRFHAASLGNYTLFTNGVDDIKSWLFDSTPPEGETVSVLNVGDLVALGISGARHIMAFGGYIFLGDYVEEGRRQSSSIIWCDYNNPLGWIPGGESLAGQFDFGRGERFLGMKPMGGGFRVYTSLAIYQVTPVNDSRVFAFEELCRNMQPIAYPNTLVSTGDEHLWVGTDTIWLMAEYDRVPRRVDWLHEAGGVIHAGLSANLVSGLPSRFPALGFLPINKARCLQPVAGWDHNSEAWWISWPTGDAVCPTKTLVLWPRTQKFSVVDHGFTAFVAHQPYFRKSLRTVVDDFRVCSKNSRLAPLESVGCATGNTPIAYPSLYNSSRNGSIPMDPNSAIAAFCGFCFDSLCGACDSSPAWVMASAADNTLKQYDRGNCSRERLTGVTDVAFPGVQAGCYEQYGYTWMMQGGASRFGDTSEQTIRVITVTFTAAEDLPYGEMEGQAGSGEQPSRISWDNSDPVSLGPQDGGLADSDAWTRGGLEPDFKFMTTGYWLNWRLFGDGIGGCFQVGGLSINGGQC